MSCMRAWLESIEADPLAGFALFRSCDVVRRLSVQFGLPYLPDHLHEILFFAILHLVIYASTEPVLSSTTKWYPRLSRSLKTGVAVHISSEVNAILALVLSFPLFFTPQLTSLVSYTPYAGFVASALSGYFLFDIYMCMRNLEDNGLGFLFHGITAFFVFLQGNRPFMHNYSAAFIWFEASTPFVNLNWLATNVPGLISKKVKTVNGAILILVFALCRIIPGPTNGYRLFRTALATDLPGVPQWVVRVILTCYITLTALNFFWFGMMLKVAYEVLSGKSTSFTSTTSPAAEEHKPVSQAAGHSDGFAESSVVQARTRANGNSHRKRKI